MMMQRRNFLAWMGSGLASVTLSLLIEKSLAFRQPQYLEDALTLLKGLQPENTKYQHEPTLVIWRTDGKSDNVCKADCSGFLNKLLFHSYGLTPKFFQQWMGTERPLAENYYSAIINANRFAHISKLKQVQPGDIIAIKYPNGEDNTGHVLLIVEAPTERQSSKPVITGTRQWEVKVIDQSRSGHGITDTRRTSDGLFRSGLGQGIFRLYSNQAGTVVGYAWSTFTNSLYYSVDTRHLAIGRLNL